MRWTPLLAILLTALWFDTILDKWTMLFVLSLTVVLVWLSINSVLWVWVHRPVSSDLNVRTRRDENIAATLILVTCIISSLVILSTLSLRALIDSVWIVLEAGAWCVPASQPPNTTGNPPPLTRHPSPLTPYPQLLHALPLPGPRITVSSSGSWERCTHSRWSEMVCVREPRPTPVLARGKAPR